MSTAFDISQLTEAERIELIDSLWSSLDEHPQLLPEQRLELRRRRERLDRTGPQGSELADVMSRLRSGY